jgi:hypothetical protein
MALEGPPSPVVTGRAEIRVSYLKGSRWNAPSKPWRFRQDSCFFPGEGRGLGRNPRHGFVKLREELKWLEKQDGAQAISSVVPAVPSIREAAERF